MQGYKKNLFWWLTCWGIAPTPSWYIINSSSQCDNWLSICECLFSLFIRIQTISIYILEQDNSNNKPVKSELIIDHLRRFQHSQYWSWIYEWYSEKSNHIQENHQIKSDLNTDRPYFSA